MSLRDRLSLFCAVAMVAAFTPVCAGAQVSPPIQYKDGKLIYVSDTKGNRVPDFSHAGFAGATKPLPQVDAKMLVEPGEGDDTVRIQSAIDEVGKLPADERGHRGAVLLAPGEYQLDGALSLTVDGVVLRGSGNGSGGTILVATGTDRRSLINITGGSSALGDSSVSVVSPVPVGAMSVRVADASTFRANQRVRIVRPGTKNWIESLGMHEGPARSGFSWKVGTVDIAWDRVITAVRGKELTLDAPLTVALETEFGGATVTNIEKAGEVEFVGVENLKCVSQYDTSNHKDEQHSWIGVQAERARDCWITDVAFEHFVYSAVYLGEGTSRITVQDCSSIKPVSEDAGYRRHTFVTFGQQTLFRRCTARNGRNDFVTGYLAAGPNVFLECTAFESTGFSGSIGSWSSGTLFDTAYVDGGELRLDNMETWNQGVGWASANSMLWQCKASRIISRVPPGAANWAVGVWGMFIGDGRWSATSEFADPDSLYKTQLKERLGDLAEELSAARTYPNYRGSAELTGRTASHVSSAAPRESAPALQLQRGWLVIGAKAVVGSEQDLTWWRGQLNPSRAREIGPSLTRFTPGRSGMGLTDDFTEMIGAMKANNRVQVRAHWGLWYDRRSDDHQMVRRPDADVWPPFYEQPWLRSGTGVAWDGLSKYDLTKFNPWYFSRLQRFAKRAQEEGLVLVNEMYFQHNILEAGAHWASFPWRPANALQETGFPEPPPYEGDKRVFMADAFYDVSHPVRRELHRTYIRQCLANLKDHPNVIHTLGAEYSGPLHFMQFWLDVVGEWMRETGVRPLIALSAPKDVQDAILVDSARAELISIIDFTYWWKSDKGLFAPAGGKNLAPRQHARQWKGGKPSAMSLAEMVSEYRAKFPSKAVITSLSQPDAWAYALAGGSLPALPSTTPPEILNALPKMTKRALADCPKCLVLGDENGDFLAYVPAGESIKIAFPQSNTAYRVAFIDRASGVAHDQEAPSARDASSFAYKNSGAEPAIVWLTRK